MVIMKKKSQFFLLGVMFFVMMFIAVVIMIQPLKETITTARDGDHLNCTADPTTLSTGTRASCIVVDMGLFYFVGVGLAAAGAFLAGRKLVGGGK